MDVRPNGATDDFTISDNGDRDKVLATVLKIIDLYTKQFPERWIYFTGNTTARTRLYRMIVSIYFEDLFPLYSIYAEMPGERGIVPFQPNIQLEGFLIGRKIF